MSAILDRNARREFLVPDAKLKAKALDAAAADGVVAEGYGYIEGYAAIWNNTDLGSEIMLRGAFSRSIQQVVPAGKVKLMIRHYRDGGDTLECVGTVTQAREDEVGLWMHAELSGAQIAQDTRRKVIEGHISGLSVGYRPLRARLEAPILYHEECALLEVTVTGRPMNPAAQVTAAKSIAEKPESTLTQNSTEASQGTGPAVLDGTAGKSATAVSTPPPASHAIKRDLELRKRRLLLP